MKLGMKLLKLLDAKGWSQEKLRESMREPVSSGSMSNWVAGKGPLPRIDQAAELARLLGCDVQFLADDTLDEPFTLTTNTDELEILAIARRLGHEEAIARLLKLESPLKHARQLTQEELISRPALKPKRPEA